MKATFAALIVSAGMIAAALAALAHHSVSGYYFMDQRATVEGDLVQFLYQNPHSFVELKSKDPNTGEMVTHSPQPPRAIPLDAPGNHFPGVRVLALQFDEGMRILVQELH